MVVRFMILLIEFYRRYISPFNPPTCRFTPSCSLYAQQALQEHHLFRGSIMAIWRLMRCHPFSRGGYDPVPGNLNAQGNISNTTPVLGKMWE